MVVLKGGEVRCWHGGGGDGAPGSGLTATSRSYGEGGDGRREGVLGRFGRSWARKERRGRERERASAFLVFFLLFFFSSAFFFFQRNFQKGEIKKNKIKEGQGLFLPRYNYLPLYICLSKRK